MKFIWPLILFLGVTAQIQANTWEIENLNLSAVSSSNHVFATNHDERGLIYFGQEGALIEDEEERDKKKGKEKEG